MGTESQQPPDLDFRLLFEASPHPYLVVRPDPAFTIAAVNDRYLDATGSRRETIIGHGLFEIFPDHPDDGLASGVSDLRASLNRVLSDRRADIMGVQKYDMPLRGGGNGFEARYWSPANTPVFGPDGGIALIIHHMEDVTEFVLERENVERIGKIEDPAERMQAEVLRRAAELKQANRALKAAFEQLERREAELARLNDRLTELDRIKTEFFANVSHELRTPLTLILGPLGKRLAAANLADAERQDLEVVERNARLLYRHATDLLDISKLEAGRMDLCYSQTDLARLARFTASHFEVLAGEKAIALRVEVPPALPAQIDVEKVQRILLNLLSNAFKFTPDGGTVALSVIPAERQAVIRVRDNGPGVPAPLREIIFEPFRQVEGHAYRRYGGTGLGLAIVRQFAELHGGKAQVENIPGDGALFTVSLPLAAPAQAALEATTEAPDLQIDRQPLEELGIRRPAALPAPFQAASAPLVLVVEDNPDMSAYLAGILGQHYRVETAFDGGEGLDKALFRQPDLIVSDIMMPDMSGDELVEALRNHPQSSDIPIVMLTAKADPKLRVKLLETGVRDYIAKPFTAEELLARVDGLLSEHLRARSQLRESEETYRSLFDHMLNGFAYCRMLFEAGRPCDFVYLSVNPAFEKLTGLKDVAGKPVSEVIPGIRQSNPALLEIYGRVAMGGGPQQFEIYVEPLAMWFSVSAYCPRPEHFVAIFDVITERKRVEASLRSSERRLRLAQDAARAGTWEWDILSNGNFWSARIWPLFGLEPYSCDPCYDAWLESVHPDDRPATEKAAREAVASGSDFEIEWRVNRADAPQRWLMSRGCPVRDDDGRIIRYIGIVMDVTARKQAELALREANRRKDEFLAMLAHELRNPLAPIRNAAHILGRLQLEEPRLRWVQETIERQVIHLNRIVDDLLDISRIVRGKIILKKEPLDLAELVNQALDSARPFIEAKRHRLELRLPERPIRLEGDPVRLSQVLLNLLDNAAKYSPEGGHIEIETDVAGAEAEIRVRDHGAGMPADLLPIVFDLFQQGERTLDRSQGGLGIGLTLVKRLVELHGGQVAASSPGAGKGSTFSIRLPVLAEAAAAPVCRTAAQVPVGAAMRVLVVDDEPAVRESTALLLRIEGHEVRMADSGDSAVEWVEAFRPHVVLLDIGLPGEDGHRVARRIRQLPGGGKLLLVAVSGYGQEQDLARSRQAGFDRHLVKPVNPDALCDLLSETAERHRRFPLV